MRKSSISNKEQEEQERITAEMKHNQEQAAQEEEQTWRNDSNEYYAVIDDDPNLKQYEHDINGRTIKYKSLKHQYADNEGSFENFYRSYNKYGLQLKENGDIEYREWAPCAKALSLFGDFNGWNRDANHCTRDDYGIWTLTLKKKEDGTTAISHNDRFKCCVTKENGERVDRVPAWSQFSMQNPQTMLYEGVFFNPPEKYVWKNKRIPRPESIRIYEAHVGMSSVHGKVSSYIEFTDEVLPKIKETGYNVIQLMAIQEHSYYGCFGYHVTNFFAPSSRCGTPNDLKRLIDTAHGMGIFVIMDCVHSHASSNVMDGINQFDGSDHHYSHGGARGYHSQWDSMLFDYSKYEVQRFLLSNLAWYMEEFLFDGFRFDAVTSILYHHHGIGQGFSGDYREYFGMHVDMDGQVYLMLANDLIHSIFPGAITIAEDVSGMPTLCRTVQDGGLGFDFRLSMYLPDMFIKLMKEYKDEDWNLGHLTFNLTNRRWREKCVAYVESHD